jgi:hypothetical protein
MASFFIDENGAVNTEAIHAWQEAQSLIAQIDRSNDASLDFSRGIKLKGESAISRHDGLKKLTELIRDADAYTEYDKLLILNWLKAHAGQVMNSFISDLFMSGHFSNTAADLFVPTLLESIDMNWEVKRGKIYYDCDIIITCIKYIHDEMSYYLMASADGELILRDDNEFELAHKNEDARKNSLKLDDSQRIKFSELDSEDEKTKSLTSSSSIRSTGSTGSAMTSDSDSEKESVLIESISIDEKVAESKRQFSMPPHLLRIQATVELMVDREHCVRPKMVSLDVISFTDKLKFPEDAMPIQDLADTLPVKSPKSIF